jgi:superfamily I DNA and RNA helicase
LIVFYEDAQNLYAKKRPRWKDIGIDVQRGDRARVMKDCFRNTREIVELGFNVLVGTQANSNMRVATREYADIAYLKQNGLIEENDNFIAVRFAKRTFEKPIIKTFKRRDQELNWIGQEIGRLVDKENVLPEDILVLFDSEREFSNLPTIIKANVGSSDLRGFVRPYGENDEDKKEYIFKKNFITVSTTRGAKGYDAYVVFLVGVDRFGTDNRGRASFYVGATRAKLRLYLTGVERKDSLVEEVKRLDQILPRY